MLYTCFQQVDKKMFMPYCVTGIPSDSKGERSMFTLSQLHLRCQKSYKTKVAVHWHSISCDFLLTQVSISIKITDHGERDKKKAQAEVFAFGLKTVNHYQISSSGSSNQTCGWRRSRGQHHYSETTKIQWCNILASVSWTVWGHGSPK